MHRILCACLLMPMPATAGPCLPYADVPGVLMREYGETLQSRATARSGEVVETYASPAGSWTMVVVRGADACLAIDGYEFQDVPQGVVG